MFDQRSTHAQTCVPKSWAGAVIVAIVFALLLFVLAITNRGSFWIVGGDYGMLSVSHALNLEWRIRDGLMYPAPSLAGHPGIPFYLASWLALALSIPPDGATGCARFMEILDHVEQYAAANQFLAITVAALSVLLFMSVARRLVPTWVGLMAIGAWIGGSYESILTVLSLSNETFALLLNAAFLWTLARLASQDEPTAPILLLAGFVAAAGYLVKLSYAYIGIGLIVAIGSAYLVRRKSVSRATIGLLLTTTTMIATVILAGYGIIGSELFARLLEFHWNVLSHSGLYGTGSPQLLSGEHVSAAIEAVFSGGGYALALALILGLSAIAIAILGWAFRILDARDVVFGIGAGVAGVAAALAVFKHYNVHYVAGVSAAVPGAVLALWLMAGGLGLHSRAVFSASTLFAVVVLGFASVSRCLDALKLETAYSQQVIDDRQNLERIIDETDGPGLFTYRVPLREFRAGFILHYAGLAELEDKRCEKDSRRVSSYLQKALNFRYVVIDKMYYKNRAAISEARDLDPIGMSGISYAKGDDIVELNRVFVVVKKNPAMRSFPNSRPTR